jgi:hypothetical protein
MPPALSKNSFEKKFLRVAATFAALPYSPHSEAFGNILFVNYIRAGTAYRFLTERKASVQGLAAPFVSNLFYPTLTGESIMAFNNPRNPQENPQRQNQPPNPQQQQKNPGQQQQQQKERQERQQQGGQQAEE